MVLGEKTLFFFAYLLIDQMYGHRCSYKTIGSLLFNSKKYIIGNIVGTESSESRSDQSRVKSNSFSKRSVISIQNSSSFHMLISIANDSVLVYLGQASLFFNSRAA